MATAAVRTRSLQSGIAATGVLAIVLLLAGLVLGPGQILWCVFLSGSKAAQYELQPDQEVVVPLRPEQNPIRFLSTITYWKPRLSFGMSRTVFRGKLRKGDEHVWSESFRVTHDSDDDESLSLLTSHTTSSLRLFSVDEAADYRFVAESTSDKDIKVKSITLKVRQNVSEVQVWPAVSGVVLLVVAVLLFLVQNRAARESSAGGPDGVSDERDSTDG